MNNELFTVKCDSLGLSFNNLTEEQVICTFTPGIPALILSRIGEGNIDGVVKEFKNDKNLLCLFSTWKNIKIISESTNKPTVPKFKKFIKNYIKELVNYVDKDSVIVSITGCGCGDYSWGCPDVSKLMILDVLGSEYDLINYIKTNKEKLLNLNDINLVDNIFKYLTRYFSSNSDDYILYYDESSITAKNVRDYIESISKIDQFHIKDKLKLFINVNNPSNLLTYPELLDNLGIDVIKKYLSKEDLRNLTREELDSILYSEDLVKDFNTPKPAEVFRLSEYLKYEELRNWILSKIE